MPAANDMRPKKSISTYKNESERLLLHQHPKKVGHMKITLHKNHLFVLLYGRKCQVFHRHIAAAADSAKKRERKETILEGSGGEQHNPIVPIIIYVLLKI